jgi:hypothetical protein
MAFFVSIFSASSELGLNRNLDRKLNQNSNWISSGLFSCFLVFNSDWTRNWTEVPKNCLNG